MILQIKSESELKQNVIIVSKTGYFGEKNKLETWCIMPFQPLRILLLNTNIIMVMTIILTVV